MATELTDLELGEWSICIDPANEDSTIEIVKSKSGLAPVLKETDMSDHNDQIDEGAGDADYEQFAAEVLSDFDALSEEEQAEAIVAMAAENLELEGAVEDATEVVKSLSDELGEIKPKFEELKKSASGALALIEKMKANGGAVSAEEGGLVADIRKSLAPGQELSPEAIARIEAIEKAQTEAAVEKAVRTARTWGFGKAEEVADLEMSIRKSLGDKKADAFVALVKQAGQLQKASPLFKSVGEDAGNPDASSPIAKAKAGAAEIRKAMPTLSEQQALTKYFDENPAEYAAYREAARTAA